MPAHSGLHTSKKKGVMFIAPLVSFSTPTFLQVITSAKALNNFQQTVPACFIYVVMHCTAHCRNHTDGKALVMCRHVRLWHDYHLAITFTLNTASNNSSILYLNPLSKKLVALTTTTMSRFGITTSLWSPHPLADIVSISSILIVHH